MALTDENETSTVCLQSNGRYTFAMLLYSKTSILVFLSLLTVGGVAVSSFDEDARALFLLVEQDADADSDDVEESSESTLLATLEPCTGFCKHVGFLAVSDEVDHQIDLLFVHQLAARAPPLG